MGREERIEMLKKEISKVNTYNRPTYCEKCGGVMVFKGVGEYECEKCGALEYDDYGKVRNYIEKHMGANAAPASNLSLSFCPKHEFKFAWHSPTLLPDVFQRPSTSQSLSSLTSATS